MGLVMMLVAAVKAAWAWLSPVVGALVAEVLLRRFRRRPRRRREKGSAADPARRPFTRGTTADLSEGYHKPPRRRGR